MSEKNYNRDFIYTLPQSVFLDQTLFLVDIRVYGLVRSFMDTTGDAYPSNGWIADKLGVENRTVQASISKLIKKGFVHRYFDGNGKRHLLAGKPVPEALVISPKHDLQITPPHDLQITQLDQRSIVQQQAMPQKQEEPVPGITLQHVLAQSHDLGLREESVVKIIGYNGLANTSRALEVYAARGVSPRNPYAWLTKCIQDRYWEEEPSFNSRAIAPEKQPKYGCMEKLHNDALAALAAEGLFPPVWDKLDPSGSFDKEVAFNTALESKKQSLNINT